MSSSRFTSGVREGLLVFLLASLSSCGADEATTGKSSPKPGAAAVIPAAVFVATEPGGAIDVREAITTAKPGADIVIRAVVGGRKKAFVDGRAILVAADARLQPCPQEEGCPTPWDYCCESKDTLLANTMTVQIVGAKGSPIAASLDGVHGLGTLKKIVVAGSVRSTEGSLVIDAKKIFVASK